MAQTGLTSAIGVAIESFFRDTPISLISGTLYEPGKANSNPLRFWTTLANGGLLAKPEVTIPDNEISGGVEPTRNKLLGKTYDGPISMEADGENLYYPLLMMFGRDVQTQVQTAGSTITTNMFKHVFTPNQYAPSAIVEEIFGDATYARLSGGVVMRKLSLDFSKDIICHMDLMPYRQVPNNYPNAANSPTDYQFGSVPAVIPPQMSLVADGTKTWRRTASPIYVDVQQENGAVINANGTFVFGAMSFGTIGGALSAAFLTINGVAYSVELLEGFTVDIERNITSQMIAGSGFDMGATTGNQVFASGRMSANFNDTGLQLAALASKKMSLNFQITGIVPGTNGTIPYTLEVHIPNFRWLVPEGPTIVDGPILTGGSWKAKKDPTLGYAIKVTLVNTFDNTQMGGMYPLNQTLASPTSAASAAATFTSAKNVVAGDVHTLTAPSINGGVGVLLTVLSVDYTTNVVTYTAVVGFIFPTATTTITRNRVGGLGGWSNV